MFKKIVLVSLLTWSFLASASGPVALVENVSTGVGTIQPFDFISPGDIIELGNTGELALGYLNSCTRETIVGGKVTIGNIQSEVAGGKSLDRIIEECNGTQLALAANESTQSGASAIRAIGQSTEPELSLSYLSPVIIVSGGGKVTVKRIDEKEDRFRFSLEKADRRFEIDFAKEEIALTPGGTYMVTAGGNSLIFEVTRTATSGSDTYLGRLLIP